MKTFLFLSFLATLIYFIVTDHDDTSRAVEQIKQEREYREQIMNPLK